MVSVRYLVLAACQKAGLRSQTGWESEAAAWIEKQGDIPCAYVGYRRGIGVAGYDNVSVVFGGNDARASLRRVRDELEKSLDFRSERQTEVGGFPALVMTARAKKRVYSVYGGASPVPPTPTVDYMYFEAVEANSTVALTSTLTTAPNLEYSTDGVTWQEWQHTTAEGVHTFDTLTLTAVGDRVYLRGDNPDGLGAVPEEEEMPLVSNFEMTGKIAAGGNIMSLLDKDAEMTEIPAFGLLFLFGDLTGENPNTSLTQAPSLPATTLAEYCYDGMFSGCTSLAQAPSLPATTLAEYCYDGMFGDCTSLTQAPSLPATTLAERCYNRMFSGCTSLAKAPSLPATTLAEYCYDEMFSGCTSLTQAPSLPATTLAEGCYGEMFSGCTSLTQAPSLPATTLAEGCYNRMFSGCTSLAKAPSLPATTLAEYCYDEMFYGCTFNMSDDGTTFNFQCDATMPQTVGDETYTTPAELAAWMGNTNGFTEP